MLERSLRNMIKAAGSIWSWLGAGLIIWLTYQIVVVGMPAAKHFLDVCHLRELEAIPRPPTQLDYHKTVETCDELIRATQPQKIP